jgi:hypothetical protein
MRTQTIRSDQFRSYDDIIAIVEQPLAYRRWLRIGRRGKYVIPRRFHLIKKQVTVLRRKYSKKRMPNPFNRGFSYYLLEALVQLGINEKHPTATVMRRVETLMSDPATVQPWNGTTAWNRWTSNTRGDRTLANDWQARFDLNVVVLQRLTGFTPYGRRLLDVGQKVMGRKGAVIDMLVSKDGQRCLRLNTHSDSPINETKTRGMGSPAALKAERAAKRHARRAASVERAGEHREQQQMT